MNLDNRSLRLNDESALVVLDPDFGAGMDSVFLSDLRSAREVTLQSHASRPLRGRLLEWLLRRVALLL
jgi:phosphatidylserine/phosphatidylglycerophosphate/cardiolipin synthase-like enzyme